MQSGWSPKIQIKFKNSCNSKSLDGERAHRNGDVVISNEYSTIPWGRHFVDRFLCNAHDSLLFYIQLLRSEQFGSLECLTQEFSTLDVLQADFARCRHAWRQVPSSKKARYGAPWESRATHVPEDWYRSPSPDRPDTPTGRRVARGCWLAFTVDCINPRCDSCLSVESADTPSFNSLSKNIRIADVPLDFVCPDQANVSNRRGFPITIAWISSPLKSRRISGTTLSKRWPPYSISRVLQQMSWEIRMRSMQFETTQKFMRKIR